MYATPGNVENLIMKNNNINGVWQHSGESLQYPQHPQHSAWVDERYLVIGGHLDKNIVEKIIQHGYVDFARLLPKNKIQREEDHRLERVSKV